MSSVASVQSTYMKNVAAFLRDAGSIGEAVLRRDPELFQEVEAAGRMRWLPIDLNVRMVRAVYAEMGDDRAHEFLVDMVVSQFETPLWKNFIEGAVRIFGLDPGSLVKWVPRAYGIAFKNCGDWRAQREDEGEAWLECDGMPDVIAGNEQWLDSLRAGLVALFRLCQTDGDVRIERPADAPGTIRFVFGWKP